MCGFSFPLNSYCVPVYFEHLNVFFILSNLLYNKKHYTSSRTFFQSSVISNNKCYTYLIHEQLQLKRPVYRIICNVRTYRLLELDWHQFLIHIKKKLTKDKLSRSRHSQDYLFWNWSLILNSKYSESNSVWISWIVY